MPESGSSGVTCGCIFFPLPEPVVAFFRDLFEQVSQLKKQVTELSRQNIDLMRAVHTKQNVIDRLTVPTVKPQRRYLFLIAWRENSPSACGIETRVSMHVDLPLEYRRGNPHVFAYRVNSESEIGAVQHGRAMAFMAGFTAQDSTSILLDLDEVDFDEQPS